MYDGRNSYVGYRDTVGSSHFGKEKFNLCCERLSIARIYHPSKRSGCSMEINRAFTANTVHSQETPCTNA